MDPVLPYSKRQDCINNKLTRKTRTINLTVLSYRPISLNLKHRVYNQTSPQSRQMLVLIEQMKTSVEKFMLQDKI